MDKPLRILHFTPFFDFSGANRSMSTLLGAAVQRGPTAACIPVEGALAEHLRSMGVEVHSSFKSHDLPRWRLRRIPGIFWGLFRAVRQFRPDIIHCHSALGNHYCKWIKRATNTPLITHQRDNYTADYFHSDLDAADGIIAISQWVFSGLSEGLQSRAMTILNPVALPEFIPAERAKGPLRVGMAGRCTPDKGFDLLIEAILPLVDEFDLHLHLWGLDGTDYGEELARLVATKQDRVRIEPFRNDIEVFYREMDIVVVPSRFQEPMGRMAIEAMAWGRPVIAAGHGGLIELIEHEKTGLLFEPGNSAALSEKIRQLATNATMCEKLGENGRAWVASTLDPARYAAKVEDFYRDLLAARTKTV